MCDFSTLKVDLNLHSKNTNCAGFLALKKLRYLKNLIFMQSGQKFSSLEIQYVSLCLNQMPKLKTVGREFKSFTEEEFKLADDVPNHYHDFFGLNCPVKTSTARVPLCLRELFTTESYLQKSGNLNLLPKLKRLHIKHETKNVYVPDTVSEIGLYCNNKPEQLRALAPRLRALTLHRCNLSGLKNGGILALCPNLEELTLHKCKAIPSDIAFLRDVKHSELRKVTLVARFSCSSDGLVSLFLQAPLLERVYVNGFAAEEEELQSLVKQVLFRRILRNVNYCVMRNDCFKELLINVRTFCPKVDFVSYKDHTE
jgi:hypothetical protein